MARPRWPPSQARARPRACGPSGEGTYVEGRVALLGDAAHAMTPFLAQGACQALEDAAVLAAELTGATEISTALTRFDRTRRPRSQRVQHMARQVPAVSLSTNPLVYTVMTNLTRFAGGGVAARKAARLWSWVPPVAGTQPAVMGHGEVK
ncbi:FAD-dependent monooxygenase [Nocardia sp. CA-120079]|uniref:FAD-dependent monooxygenase n=1 Tax=Nocardia sp. CA-120079 TaxID=3239974 RepID=UPI003D967267